MIFFVLVRFHCLSYSVDNPIEKWVELSVDADNDQVQFISGKHGRPTEIEFQLAMENLKTVSKSHSPPSCSLRPLVSDLPFFAHLFFFIWCFDCL